MSVTIHDYVLQGKYSPYIEKLYGGSTTIDDYHKLLEKRRISNYWADKRMLDALRAKHDVAETPNPVVTSLGSLQAIRAACYMWWYYEVDGVYPNRYDSVFNYEQRRRCIIWHRAQEEAERQKKAVQQEKQAAKQKERAEKKAAAEKTKADTKALVTIEKLVPLCRQYNGHAVSTFDLYRDVFKMYLDPHPWIQDCSNSYTLDQAYDHRANPLLYCKNDVEEHGHYRILFRDTFDEEIERALSYDFAILNGLTYFGKTAKKNSLSTASKMFAMIFDIDYINQTTLKAFFSGAKNNVYPFPNYIVLSGHGMHLYYLFDQPINLYPKVKEELKKLKKALTTLMWNRYTVSGFERGHNVQIQGINQPFRMGGSKTKINGYNSLIFDFGKPLYTVEKLYDYIKNFDDCHIDKDVLFNEKPYPDSKYTMEEAKEKFPEWYESRIVEGKPKKTYVVSKALYDWFIRQILAKGVFGHRYHCILALAIYGLKCGVSHDQIRKDAYSLQGALNKLNEDEPFTAEDIESALKVLNKGAEETRIYMNYTRETISNLCGITMTKGVRKGRKQSTHLKMCRNNLEILNEENGRALQGRKQTKDIVIKWRTAHPNGKKADCVRDTGLTKPTVYKWWDSK